jgi:hypothetical protein
MFLIRMNMGSLEESAVGREMLLEDIVVLAGRCSPIEWQMFSYRWKKNPAPPPQKKGCRTNLCGLVFDS